MENKLIEEIIESNEKEKNADSPIGMETTQADLFDVLMGRCPPSTIALF